MLCVGQKIRKDRILKHKRKAHITAIKSVSRDHLSQIAQAMIEAQKQFNAKSTPNQTS
jgi:hypothetical protein